MRLNNIQKLTFEFDEIDYIEDIGYKECVDIEVLEDKSFTLYNGIISHNSAQGGLAKVLGNKGIGYYCLKGKILNTFDISHQKFSTNKELKELYSIIQNEQYKKICVASDNDIDGHHIASLFFVMIEKFLPEYKDRIYKLNTPVKLALKNKKPQRWVYNVSDDLEIKQGEDLKYIKGLGGWSPELFEAVVQKDKLENMLKKIDFDDYNIMKDFFSENESDKRKEYIKNHIFSIASL